MDISCTSANAASQHGRGTPPFSLALPYIYTHIYTYIYTYTHIYIYTRCIDTPIHIYRKKDISRTSANAASQHVRGAPPFSPALLYIYTHIYTHTYTHICIYIYTRCIDTPIHKYRNMDISRTSANAASQHGRGAPPFSPALLGAPPLRELAEHEYLRGRRLAFRPPTRDVAC